MEELFSDDKLEELEGKIDVLLQSYMAMKGQQGGLADRLNSLETENKQLKERLARAEDEKNVILHKVRNILDKIRGIEV